MAYDMRLLNNPMKTGYLVKEKIRCGKKNCRCYTKSEPHSAYYLHYREYTRSPKRLKRTYFEAKKRKKYIKKIDVERIKKEIAVMKAGFVYDKLPDEVLVSLGDKCKGQEEFLAACYQTYLEKVWGHKKTS